MQARIWAMKISLIASLFGVGGEWTEYGHDTSRRHGTHIMYQLKSIRRYKSFSKCSLVPDARYILNTKYELNRAQWFRILNWYFEVCEELISDYDIKTNKCVWSYVNLFLYKCRKLTTCFGKILLPSSRRYFTVFYLTLINSPNFMCTCCSYYHSEASVHSWPRNKKKKYICNVSLMLGLDRLSMGEKYRSAF